MNIAIVIVALILGYIVFRKFKSNVPEIEKIEEKKKVLVEKVDKLEAERKDLKDKAVAQEANATEEHKEEFWEELMGKKKDDK